MLLGRRSYILALPSSSDVVFRLSLDFKLIKEQLCTYCVNHWEINSRIYPYLSSGGKRDFHLQNTVRLASQEILRSIRKIHN